MEANTPGLNVFKYHFPDLIKIIKQFENKQKIHVLLVLSDTFLALLLEAAKLIFKPTLGYYDSKTQTCSKKTLLFITWLINQLSPFSQNSKNTFILFTLYFLSVSAKNL